MSSVYPLSSTSSNDLQEVLNLVKVIQDLNDRIQKLEQFCRVAGDDWIHRHRIKIQDDYHTPYIESLGDDLLLKKASTGRQAPV